MDERIRIERDSMGEVRVPAQALYGAQTQRAVDNFTLSPYRLPAVFIRALGWIKHAAALANEELQLLPRDKAQAIAAAAAAVAAGRHDADFPLDVFQTGSGTSTNMNANEVIAALATRAAGRAIHPNDDVNMGQSSNDAIPSALHVSAAWSIRYELLPGLETLATTLDRKIEACGAVTKTGRTHLMDATPITLGQEMSGWRQQTVAARERIAAGLPALQAVPLGGTAVGTGLNAHPRFSSLAARHLSRLAGLRFEPAANFFAGMAAQDAVVDMSGRLRAAAVALMKICHDLRWMNSGPIAGLGEITLPALQPGSSIMPGKINPVIPEAVSMACAQVMGNDVTVGIAGQSGAFQLNVMLPLLAHSVLESVALLGNASRLLAEKAIADFTVNAERMQALLARNPILITALNPVIGYARGAAIVKKAYAENRSLKEVALEMTDLSASELDTLLDPVALTQGGIPAV